MAEIDERFEFDAPRFFDFQTMTSDCSPADAWFDTAPEGPGMRPAGAAARHGWAGAAGSARWPECLGGKGDLSSTAEYGNFST